MKIRTLGALQDAIDREMGWRKKELTAIKANIQSARRFAKGTALRSGIALLYAHWEGAIKNISYYYLCYVCSLKLPYNKLKINFLALSIKDKLGSFTSTSKTSLYIQILDAAFEQYPDSSKIPQKGIIKTRSNLNSTVFSEIACSIGISAAPYESNFKLIDEVLLKMRNKIAHGEQLIAINLDENRYNEIHENVFKLIYQFSTHISNSASLKEYMRQ